jgi:hypothetical protein
MEASLFFIAKLRMTFFRKKNKKHEFVVFKIFRYFSENKFSSPQPNNNTNKKYKTLNTDNSIIYIFKMD